MSTNELLAKLSDARESFEDALARVQKTAPGELLLGLLARFDSEDILDNSEKERRFTLVYRRSSPQAADLAALGEAAAAARNAVLRNAVTQLLPADYKSLVFRGKASSPTIEKQTTDSSESQAEAAAQVALPEADQQMSFSDVLVLSIVDDPATNKLLKSRRFFPLRCKSLGKLDEMLKGNEEICAFLVESSFLQSLHSDEQAQLIRKLAGSRRSVGSASRRMGCNLVTRRCPS